MGVFGQSVAYWGELQAEGRIEWFDVTLLSPCGDLNGFAVLHGTHEEFADLLRRSAGFVRLSMPASLSRTCG